MVRLNSYQAHMWSSPPFLYPTPFLLSNPLFLVQPPFLFSWVGKNLWVSLSGFSLVSQGPLPHRTTETGKSDIEPALQAVLATVAHACYLQQAPESMVADCLVHLSRLLQTPPPPAPAPTRKTRSSTTASKRAPGSAEAARIARLLPVARGFRPLSHSFDCLMDRATHTAKDLEQQQVLTLLCAMSDMAAGGYWSYTTLIERLLGKLSASIQLLEGRDVAAVLLACTKAKKQWVARGTGVHCCSSDCSGVMVCTSCQYMCSNTQLLMFVFFVKVHVLSSFPFFVIFVFFFFLICCCFLSLVWYGRRSLPPP